MGNLSLPERIVMMRARHGWSQSDFAKECGLSAQIISAVESGKKMPGNGLAKTTVAKIILLLEREKEIEMED